MVIEWSRPSVEKWIDLQMILEMGREWRWLSVWDDENDVAKLAKLAKLAWVQGAWSFGLLKAGKEKQYTSNDGICISLVFSLICFSSQTQRKGFICWVSFRNSNCDVSLRLGGRWGFSITASTYWRRMNRGDFLVGLCHCFPLQWIVKHCFLPLGICERYMCWAGNI